jgi:FKBP-type peptidyl-prolyl cis-trans isomerase FkpA
MSTRSERARRRAARQRNQRIAIIAFIIFVIALVAFFVWQGRPQKADTSGDMTTTASGLQYEDLEVGDGATAEAGNTVFVHYTGWLEDGTKFDSSLDRGTPFDFILGTGNVIQGWDEGVAGMKVGGVRKLVIPPELGYGPSGAGNVIPPNATLIFEVELLEVR